MIRKFKNNWNLENKFYFNIDPSRIRKIISHYEIFKKSKKIKGAIIECGVFKGNSLLRFMIFRDILQDFSKKKIIGFDVFGKFPKQKIKRDNIFSAKHNKEIGLGVNYESLLTNFKNKKFKNFYLIKGPIEKTLYNFIKKNKNLKISFLHLDLDVYQPTYFALSVLYNKVSKGGIILLDDYGKVYGATKATNEFLKKNKLKQRVQSLKFDKKLMFIIKK